MEGEWKYLEVYYGHLTATIDSNSHLENEVYGRGIQVVAIHWILHSGPLITYGIILIGGGDVSLWLVHITSPHNSSMM